MGRAGKAIRKPHTPQLYLAGMSDHESEILSEAEAARLWARAAQLQAESAGRVEDPGVRGGALPPPGYALTHVRSAAVEAGIADEFVDLALADLRAERSLGHGQGRRSLAMRFLRDPPSAITVRRVIGATAQEVLAAMEEVLPAEPYLLTLVDRQGDPADRGALVFDINRAARIGFQGFAFETRDAGLKQLMVSLRPLPGSQPSCEITVSSPVTVHNVGFAIGSFLTLLTGAGGLMAGVGIGIAIAGGPLIPVGAALGAVAGGGLGMKGFRFLYARSMRVARKALEGLTSSVAARATGGWGARRGVSEAGSA